MASYVAAFLRGLTGSNQQSEAPSLSPGGVPTYRTEDLPTDGRVSVGSRAQAAVQRTIYTGDESAVSASPEELERLANGEIALSPGGVILYKPDDIHTAGRVPAGIRAGHAAKEIIAPAKAEQAHWEYLSMQDRAKQLYGWDVQLTCGGRDPEPPDDHRRDSAFDCERDAYEYHKALERYERALERAREIASPSNPAWEAAQEQRHIGDVFGEGSKEHLDEALSSILSGRPSYAIDEIENAFRDALEARERHGRANEMENQVVQDALKESESCLIC